MADKLTQAEVIQRLMNMRNEIDSMLDILLPDEEEGECSHPPSHVKDTSAMGEEEYTCTLCGKVSNTPFH
jgi:hypothetical protein